MTLPIVHPTHSHYRRADMPQITDVPAFLSYLRTRAIPHRTRKIAPSRLHPTQNEINLELVLSIMEEGIRPGSHILVASDYYIIDGHNRWYAASFLRERISTIVVNMRHPHLINLALNWDGSLREEI